MGAKEWFAVWFNSPYYHKLYFEHDEAEARKFILKLLQYLKPAAGSRMVDIACGRGRHSRILAEAGYEVTGVDLAQDSILFAQQFETEKLHFFVHDMRLPFWINYFDYAFNFFTSFGYFATRREHEDAIRTIASGLKPRGVLVLDYLNVHYSEAHLKPNEEKTIGETVYEIHRWQDEHHFYKKITVNDPALNQPAEYTEKVAKFTLGDFTDMLSYQKMQVSNVCGDYLLNSYNIKNSPRLVIIANKV